MNLDKANMELLLMRTAEIDRYSAGVRWTLKTPTYQVQKKRKRVIFVLKGPQFDYNLPGLQ